MALIKCPECGREISNLAAAYPNCGCPIVNKPNSVKIRALSDNHKLDAWHLRLMVKLLHMFLLVRLQQYTLTSLQK